MCAFEIKPIDNLYFWLYIVNEILVNKESIDQIDFLNSLRTHAHSAIYGITEFADLTRDEFARTILTKTTGFQDVSSTDNIDEALRVVREFSYDGLPVSINW